MSEPPKGTEIWHITCRSCRREVLFLEVWNDLVGMQDRLVCEACGHRGADTLRVHHQGPPPKGARVWPRK